MQSEVLILNDGYASTICTIPEKASLAGLAYRVGTGYVSLTVGQYASINIITPATGNNIYSFSSIDKTGNELQVTLMEGDTYTGGSNAPLWNYNRIIGDDNPPYVCKTGGTTTGGKAAPIRLIPGVAQGNSKPGSSSESASGIVLKTNTSYTLKITAMGDVTLAAFITLVWRVCPCS